MDLDPFDTGAANHFRRTPGVIVVRMRQHDLLHVRWGFAHCREPRNDLRRRLLHTTVNQRHRTVVFNERNGVDVVAHGRDTKYPRRHLDCSRHHGLRSSHASQVSEVLVTTNHNR